MCGFPPPNLVIHYSSNRKPCSFFVKEPPLFRKHRGCNCQLTSPSTKEMQGDPNLWEETRRLEVPARVVEWTRHHTGQGAQNVPTGQVGAWKGHMRSRWPRRVLKTPCLEVRGKECFKEETLHGALRAPRKATGLYKNMSVCGELYK